jgi:hypothetical protein
MHLGNKGDTDDSADNSDVERSSTSSNYPIMVDFVPGMAAPVSICRSICSKI